MMLIRCSVSLFFVCQSLSKLSLVTSTPTPCSDGITEGYSTWEQLQDAIDNEEEGDVLTICPNSFLQASSDRQSTGFHANHSVKIRCGSDGARANACTIVGPGRYLQLGSIGQDPSTYSMNFEISGVTFQGGTTEFTTSVWIDESATGNFLFNDCAFEDIDSQVAVISSSLTGTSVFILKNCDFKRNKVGKSLIEYGCPSNTCYSYHGTDASFVIDGCTFVDNGEIFNNFYSYGYTISISNSCFIRNKGVQKRSIIKVDHSVPVSQTNNYSDGNEVSDFYRYKDTCHGVLAYESPYEYTSRTVCHQFEATECDADPSFPVIAPRVEPECIDDQGWKICNPDCHIFCPLIDEEGCGYEYYSMDEACCGCGGGNPTASILPSSSPSPSASFSLLPSLLPSSSPSNSPCSDGITRGSSTWEQLQDAIDTGTHGSVITICPNSVLQTPSDRKFNGLEVNHSVKIRCGSDGARANACTIMGPERYLQLGSIGQDPSTYNMNFEISGVTLQGPSGGFGPVWIAESATGNFLFNDCAFEDLDAYNDVIYSAPCGTSTITLKKCDFRRNEGTVIQGSSSNCDDSVTSTSFVIDGCTFVENEHNSGSTLPTIFLILPDTLTAERTLSISNSCFVHNTAPYKSIIEVDPGLTVSQTNNYSDGNDIPYDYRYRDTCNGVLASQSITDKTPFCYKFEATKCAADPTLPVINPPVQPECIDVEGWVGCSDLTGSCFECFIQEPFYCSLNLLDKELNMHMDEACCGCGGGNPTVSMSPSTSTPPSPAPFQWQGNQWDVAMTSSQISVVDGLLTFLPGAIGRKHIRLKYPIHAPFRIEASFRHVAYFTDFYVMVSKNPDLEFIPFSNARADDALFFEFLGGAMLIDGTSENDSALSETCNHDADYNIHILVDETIALMSTDKGCESLSILDSIGGHGDLYIYLGVSSDYGPYNASWTTFELVEESTNTPSLTPTSSPTSSPTESGSSTSSVQIQSFILTLFLLCIGRLIQ